MVVFSPVSDYITVLCMSVPEYSTIYSSPLRWEVPRQEWLVPVLVPVLVLVLVPVREVLGSYHTLHNRLQTLICRLQALDPLQVASIHLQGRYHHSHQVCKYPKQEHFQIIKSWVLRKFNRYNCYFNCCFHGRWNYLLTSHCCYN